MLVTLLTLLDVVRGAETEAETVEASGAPTVLVKLLTPLEVERDAEVVDAEAMVELVSTSSRPQLPKPC